MRRGLAKILNLVASVNRMAIFHEEDGMRHGGIVPLLAVPNLVHRGGSKGPRWRRVSRLTGGDWPVIAFHPIEKDCHLLLSLVDVDEDGCRNRGRSFWLSCRSLRFFATDISRVVPAHACAFAIGSFRHRLRDLWLGHSAPNPSWPPGETARGHSRAIRHIAKPSH